MSRKRSRKEKKAIHAKKRKTMQHKDDFTVGYGYASDHTKRSRSRDYGDVF
jgi:hypothetical protein